MNNLRVSTPCRVLAVLIGIICLLLIGCAGGGSDQAAPETTNLSASARALLIAEDDFETGGFSAFWNDPMVNMLNYTATGQSPFVTSPVYSGNYAAHYYLVEGSDERTPLQVSQIQFETEEFYVEWHEYLDADYPAPLGQKLCRFVGPNLLEANLINLDHNQRLQIYWYSNGREAQIDIPHGIELERWNTFGFWVKLNTVGESDGFVRLYLEGTLIASLEDQEIRVQRDTFQIMWVGGNYSNNAPLPSSGSRYIDDVKWFSSKP